MSLREAFHTPLSRCLGREFCGSAPIWP